MLCIHQELRGCEGGGGLRPGNRGRQTCHVLLMLPTLSLVCREMSLWSSAGRGSRDLQVFSGWVATLIIAGFVAAFITAIGVFSPNKVSSMDAVTVVSTLNGDTLHMINQMRSGAANNAALGAQLMVCLAFHICS